MSQPICPQCKRLPALARLNGLCDPCFGLVYVKRATENINQARSILHSYEAERSRLLDLLRSVRETDGLPRRFSDSDLLAKAKMRCYWCKSIFANAAAFGAHESKCPGEPILRNGSNRSEVQSRKTIIATKLPKRQPKHVEREEF